MKRLILAVMILWISACVVRVASGQAPEKLIVANQAAVVEHSLQESVIDKARLLPDEKQCSFFLQTTFGGKMKPGLRFQFLDATEGSQQKIRVELVPLTRINVFIDEKKDIPTAAKIEVNDGEFAWTLRLSTKAYESCRQCLPEPIKPAKTVGP